MTKSTSVSSAPRTRISLFRVTLVLVCTGLLGWAGFNAFASVVTKPIVPGPSVFASYVDVTVTPTYSFGTPVGPAQSHVILSFIVADPTSSCTPLWGGAYSLDEAAADLELDRRISQLRSTGGEARVSFGGQAGTEIAVTCTDEAALQDAYQSVVDRYTLTGIDLDIEGASLADPEAGVRRAAAIKAVQDQTLEDGRSLSVWLTLPVAPTGLTAEGITAVDQMLAAGVDLAGVNGMTMDFNSGVSATAPYSDVVLEASTALHAQVTEAYARIGTKLSVTHAWEKVGITPMIGQNDIPGEVFTLGDAATVNEFARANGVGQLSMWSLNRDATCQSPLPTVLTVVQTFCSGVDQGGKSFAEVLAEDLPSAPFESSDTDDAPSASASPSESPTAVSTDEADDPETSPFPIWDPLGTYPTGTMIVWHHNVYEARYWTSGVAPDTQAAVVGDLPWILVGPVLPGDTPAPLPTLPAGSYPQWDVSETYSAGTRVQLGNVPYEAKWWSEGQEPGVAVAGGSPWVLITPASAE
ncbi:chitinase [Demequina aurantiaca]|uniref:chitinase n=1 Tax=Demequina aurantiaca TaxID=676200 RepID=UPI003D32624D